MMNECLTTPQHEKQIGFGYIWKEGHVLFSVALNTFYLQLYGISHMVKYHSDSKRKHATATWVILSD